MRTLRAATAVLAACAVFLAPQLGRAAERQNGQAVLRLGISSTLFQGMPESIVIALMKPFEGLLIEQTGMGGELIPSGDGAGVARALIDGKLDVGVLEGIEYAWEREKHPELKPLMITINQEKCLHACLVVRKGSPAKQIADLKGKPMGMFRNAREHCRLYLKHLCDKVNGKPDQFFSKLCRIDNAEGVLDDVVDGNVEAAVVDNLSLDCFLRRKPARFQQLVVLEKSQKFPASVVRSDARPPAGCKPYRPRA